MQQLLGDKAWETDNAFIRELFMQRLPANVRMVLPSTPDMGNLDELAQLADKIMEVAIPSGPTIAAVSSTTSELEHLRKKVAELKSLLQGLRSPKQPSTRCSPSPNRQPQEQLCWYHNKYGDNAQKCKPPLQEVGKLPGHAVKATGVAGLSHSRLFYITDTVLPSTSSERPQKNTDFTLVAVNGATIPTYGKCSLTLNLGLRRTFRWVFVAQF